MTVPAPVANGEVFALGDSMPSILATGQFTDLTGEARDGVGAIDSAGVTTEWNPDIGPSIRAIVPRGDTLLMGGGACRRIGLSAACGFFPLPRP